MYSLIIATATRLLVGVMLAVSIFLLLRGHNEPGGGFIGGLVAATAFGLFAMAHGTEAAKAALKVEPRFLAMVGLALAIAAGVWGLLAGEAFLTGMWPLLETAADGSKKGLPVGSVLLFDVGVFLVVVGSVLAIAFALDLES